MPLVLDGLNGFRLPAEGSLKLYENSGNGENSIALKAPASVAADKTFVLPGADGTNGQYLKTDGSGNLGFASLPTFPSGTIVGTTDTQTLTNKTLTTPLVTGGRETRVAMGANDINLSAGNFFSKTISGATTLTVSNVPSTGTATSFILDLTNGGSATITWWSGVQWVGGAAPSLTASGRDVLGFFTYDGGTTWTGLVVGKDVK